MQTWFASRFRVARPTDQLDQIVRFYRDGLGLSILGTFENHDLYDGVIFGLPDLSYQLEFTQHADGSPCPAPTADNLLVFYIPDSHELERIITRLGNMGHTPVTAENPYWTKHGAYTIPDPDGWRIVLMLA